MSASRTSFEGTKLLVEREIAELETMRVHFLGMRTAAGDAMAHVCGWSKERFQLLLERMRLLEHEAARG